MNNYTYSITITHYNSPSLLERMLKSIPEREDIQVIVVDDASCKEAKDAIAQLQHKNLQVIYTLENHGAGYERNVGLEHAKGKWLIACDCDDIFAEGAFDVLDKYKNSNYDYICYCVTCLNEKLEPTGRRLRSDDAVRNYILKKSRKNIKYFKFWNTEPWNKMVSLDFIKKNKIRWEECRINVDVYFSFQLALASQKYMAIPDELYHFVGDDNSITRKKRSIEREFGFYLAQQKRNGFFKILGYGYPFSKPDWLYLPYLLKKRGVKDTITFYNYRQKHWQEVVDARMQYIHLLDGIDRNTLLGS